MHRLDDPEPLAPQQELPPEGRPIQGPFGEAGPGYDAAAPSIRAASASASFTNARSSPSKLPW